MEENDKALQRFAAVNYIRQLHAQEFSLERSYLLASEKSWGGKYYSARSFEHTFVTPQDKFFADLF